MPRLALLLLALSLPALASNERVVVAFENRSPNASAVGLVAGSLDGVLLRKGYELVDGVEVSDFLEAEGAKGVDPLPPGMVNRMLLRFQADAVLTVVINFVLEPGPRNRGPAANPAVGMSARLVISDDEVRWRNSLGVLADDAGGKGRETAAGAVRTTVGAGSERLLYALPKAKASAFTLAAKEPLPLPTRAARRDGPRFQLLIRRAERRAGRKNPRPAPVNRLADPPASGIARGAPR